MDSALQKSFIAGWEKYFGGAPLPIGFYYTDKPAGLTPMQKPQGRHCLIGDLARVRGGAPLVLDGDNVVCSGGLKYLGFSNELRPGFEYFLSCGIAGTMEGERYKKTPEIVRQLLAAAPAFQAPAKYIVFKRWDMFEADELPEVVIFLARADVLSGLFTLANFEATDPYGVISPFSAGCGSIVQYPYLERDAAAPRAVIGMFDVSARPCVPAGELSFAIPWPRFQRMVDNMPESFLITHSWQLVQRRLEKETKS